MEAMRKLDDIVADYISRYQERAEKELRWFSIQRTLEEAVRISALAKSPSGKRLSHQRRIPESVLRESYRNLLDGLSALQEAKSFKQLHSSVASMIGQIPGIGQLTVYDTSLRIKKNSRSRISLPSKSRRRCSPAHRGIFGAGTHGPTRFSSHSLSIDLA
jgi:hypothetical protein